MSDSNKKRSIFRKLWWREKRAIRSYGASGAFALWLILLAATIPAISRHWTWLRFDLLPADVLSSVYGRVYLGFCALVFLLFVLLARRRRLIFGAFLILLAVLQILTQAIGWDRLVILAASVSAFTVFFEAVRQNVPLFRELQSQNESLIRLLGRSLYLWSPMLVFVLLGVMANKWLISASENFIYGTAEIDQYCQIENVVGVVVPCTDLDGILDISQIREVTREEAMRGHISQVFLQNKKALISEASLAIDPDNESQTSQELFAEYQTTVKSLFAEMIPAKILSIHESEDPLARRLAADAEYQKLTAELREETAKLKKLQKTMVEQVKVSFVGGIALQKLGELTKTEKNRRALEKKIRQRQEEVKTQIANDESASAEVKIDALRRILNKQLNKPLRSAAGHEKKLQADRSDHRVDHLKVQILRNMDALEDWTGSKATKLLKDNEDSIALGALGASKSCTISGPSETILGALEETDVEVNKSRFQCLPGRLSNTLILNSLGLRESVDRSIKRWYAEEELNIERDMRTLMAANFESANDVKNGANALGDTVPPAIYLGRKKCTLIRIGNCIGNFAKRKTEEGYSVARVNFDKKYNAAVTKHTDEVAKTVDGQLLRTRMAMYDTLDASRSLIARSVDRLHQTGRIVAAVFSLLLILAIIKSFLYVLATEVFDSDEIATIDLDAQEKIEGQYVASSHLEIPREFSPKLVTKAVLDNQEINKVPVPWPFSGVLARLRHGAYFGFNKGTHHKHGDEEMAFSQASGKMIIDWQMQEGEEVIFHYRNFFGVSENVKLKTTISLRLSTLLMGRFVFHSACCTEGEGRLLLVTGGQVAPDQNKITSTSLDRLIAWNKHAKFRVSSNRTIKSVFVDGYTIVRVKQEEQDNGLILVEAIGAHRSALAGAVQFIKTMLLPF